MDYGTRIAERLRQAWQPYAAGMGLVSAWRLIRSFEICVLLGAITSAFSMHYQPQCNKTIS